MVDKANKFWETSLRANNPITNPLDSDLIVNLTDWHCADTWEINAERIGDDPNKIRDKYRWKPTKKKAPSTNNSVTTYDSNPNKKKIVIDRYGKLVAVDASEDSDLLDDSVSANIPDAVSDSDDVSEADDEEGEGEGEEEQDNSRYDETFNVIGFGLTALNQSVTIQLEGFKPYFFIKVPDNWGPPKVDELIEQVKKGFNRNAKTAKFALALSAYKLIPAKPFRDFTGSDLFNFVRLTFNDKESWSQWSLAFRRPIRLWSYNSGQPNTYGLYESNIIPLLRLLHIQEIAPSGWIRIKKEHCIIMEPNNPSRLSRAQLEVRANYKNTLPYELPAGQDAITRMIQLSYDIEADSSHGDFPIAKKDYQKLAQDLISESNRIYADKESIIHRDPFKLVNHWLNLAFNKYHGPYNINAVTLLSNTSKADKEDASNTSKEAKDTVKDASSKDASPKDASSKDDKEEPKNNKDINKLIDESVDSILLEFFDKYYQTAKKIEKKDSHDDDEGIHEAKTEFSLVEEEKILEELIQMQGELAEHFKQIFPEAEKVPSLNQRGTDISDIVSETSDDVSNTTSDSSTSNASNNANKVAHKSKNVVKVADKNKNPEIIPKWRKAVHQKEMVNAYDVLSIQVLAEYTKNKSTNNKIFHSEPRETIAYMLKLAFDGIWNAHTINRIYTKSNPDPLLIEKVSVEVLKVIKNCNDFLRNKEIKRNQKKKAKPKVTGAKAKLPKPPKSEKEKELENRNRNYYVEDLTKVLNLRFAKYPVIGDCCIQIGSTFQRYGEKHPYLKHIIVLNTCTDIKNETTISHEHKDITFPLKELISTLAGVRKELRSLNATSSNASTSASSAAAASTEKSEKVDDFSLKEPLKEPLKEEPLKAEVETPIKTKIMEAQDFLLSLPEGEDFDKTLKKLSKEDPKRIKLLNDFLLDWNKNQQLGEDKSIVVVESYNTEEEVLLAWTRLVQKSDPDIIIGYNIFGFDFDFLYQRSQVLGIDEKFGQLGRIKGVQHKLFTQELSSSGLGENILKYIPMYGRVLIDMFKVVQANYKLPIYKLDYVCKHFLYKSKNDLPPKEIFILQKGDADDRRKIAEYCLIDCVLVNRLINKLDIITNQIGMSNVCMVPLSYLFLRGQGVKILSLVSMFCRKEGFLIPVLKKPDENEEGFEGAIVLPPQNAIFFEPVAVSDFNSLYPSCIIAENLCHTSHTLKGGKYDNLPGYTYVDISYDRYKYEAIPGKKKMRKVKCGVETCRYVQLPDGQKSLLPRIEQNLLGARAQTRVEQKAFPKDSFQWKVKEGLQLAYKVTANSLYGQVGAKTSAIYYKNIAACTTATGRSLIYFTKKYFETNYEGAVTVYGDSVTGDTPILVRDRSGKIMIKTIESLHLPETPEASTLSEAAFEGSKVDAAWKPYREFKSEDTTTRWDKEQCSTSYEVWSSNGWTPIKRVIRHKTNKRIYRVTTGLGSVDVTEDHSLLNPKMQIVKPSEISVGQELLHGYPKVSEPFPKPSTKTSDTSGTSNTSKISKGAKIQVKGKLAAAELQLKLHMEGYITSLDIVEGSSEDPIYVINYDKNNNKDARIAKIIQIDELQTDLTGQFVYDLETEEGNFQAGVGQIIVKNTDSVFEKFKCLDAWGRPLKGLDAIYKSMEHSIEGSLAVSRLLKPPHNLEFEKAIWPFILITKKRYHGHYYTSYGSPEYYANSMGIALKRRDNAPIVKKVLGSTIDIIMKEHDVAKAMQCGQQMARDLLDGKYPIEDFIITKTLRSFYKTPMTIAHNVLSMRIAKRDPGNKPQANDRIPYAYIITPKLPKHVKVLQGECIETPQFIDENQLKINYKFYLTNQIMKPVSQIFSLVTDDLAHLFYDAIRDYDYKIQGIRKIMDFAGYKVVPLDRSAYANLNKEIKKLLSEDDRKSEGDDGEDTDADTEAGEEDEGEDDDGKEEEELDDRAEEIVGLEIADEGGED